MGSTTSNGSATFGRSVRIRSDNPLVKGCRLFAKSELTPSRVPWLRRSLAVRSCTDRGATNIRDRSPAIDRLRRSFEPSGGRGFSVTRQSASVGSVTINDCVTMLHFEKEVAILGSHRPCSASCLTPPPASSVHRPPLHTPLCTPKQSRFHTQRSIHPNGLATLKRILGGFAARYGTGLARPAASIGAASLSSSLPCRLGSTSAPSLRPPRRTVDAEWPPGRVKVIDLQYGWSAASMALLGAAIHGPPTTQCRSVHAAVPHSPRMPAVAVVSAECRTVGWLTYGRRGQCRPIRGCGGIWSNECRPVGRRSNA